MRKLSNFLFAGLLFLFLFYCFGALYVALHMKSGPPVATGTHNHDEEETKPPEPKVNPWQRPPKPNRNTRPPPPVKVSEPSEVVKETPQQPQTDSYLSPERLADINNRWASPPPMNERGFRDPSDRPPKEGVRPRTRQEETTKLNRMWHQMDKAAKQKPPKKPSLSPEVIWRQSVIQFEERMKILQTPNATRHQLAVETREILQAEIEASQNPTSCEDAKYLYVENDKRNYGFGAQLHHFVYALIVGYASNRVVVLEKQGFKYAQQMHEWCGDDLSVECFFQPLGKCTRYVSDEEGKNASLWIAGDETTSDQILRLRFRSSVEYRHWIPRKLMDRLSQFHENAHLWFIGQFTHYVMRPSNKLYEGYQSFKALLPEFQHPVMGYHLPTLPTDPRMHVRGHEKAKEAPVHPLKDYMPSVKYSTIYLATDDEENVKAIADFPDYTWVLGKDPESGRLSGVGDRHSKNAILTLLYDIYILSECDFFIGTDSSQVSRAAYELMQTMNDDATRLAVSLDTMKKDHTYSFYWFLI